MNRPEAEKLLGGFALGILTEEEKATLFAAALEHQTLFDALMDEEALRALLADPTARQELLAAFPKAPVKLWRRPAVIGLAASLFLLATTGLVLLRRGEVPIQRTIPAEPAKPAVPTEEDKVQAAPLQSAPPKAAKPRKTEAVPMVKTAPPEANLYKEQTPVGAGAELADRAAAPQARAMAAPPEPAPPAPVAAAGLAESKAESKAKGATMASRIQVAPPVFTPVLERLPGGRARLKVGWGPTGQLYVLLRTPDGVKVLAPLKAVPEPDGRTTSLFEMPLGAQDRLDVYHLPAPVADPAALPEGSIGSGEYRRIHP